ncbi:hypothetical protein NDU88_003128 [Pleurodeles waltl]|uniref:Uncharacterized protein n=1 Tax=Pleurodeles waltl TaxID=8319 RepID=A0AAV7V1I8_PLEWA|nr:hypothetical protein NDU88_003128 [Pleurodeles waltl]
MWPETRPSALAVKGTGLHRGDGGEIQMSCLGLLECKGVKYRFPNAKGTARDHATTVNAGSSPLTTHVGLRYMGAAWRAHSWWDAPPFEDG